MNDAQKKQAERLRQRLKPGEVVAFNAGTGRCCVFSMGPNRTPEALSRYGWEVVYTYTPEGIKLAAAHSSPDTIETDVPVKRGRKPKQEQP